jgi:ABC-2 type transport system permease protein
MAIGLGFDAVNGEHNRRTLSRILAQPIYRDALLFGKFLAGLMTLSISLITLWLLVIGLGLIMIGIPARRRGNRPQLCLSAGDDRLCRRLAGAGAFVLDPVPLGRDRGADHARACGCSSPSSGRCWRARSRRSIVPPDPRYMALGLQTPGTAELEQILARLSPSTLFAEVVVALLDPTTRALGPIYLSQLQGAVLGAPLPLGESILIAWPQIVGMIATAIMLFVIGYVIFQRQEVRA